jgi:hypothetical protein
MGRNHQWQPIPPRANDAGMRHIVPNGMDMCDRRLQACAQRLDAVRRAGSNAEAGPAAKPPGVSSFMIDGRAWRQRIAFVRCAGKQSYAVAARGQLIAQFHAENTGAGGAPDSRDYVHHAHCQSVGDALGKAARQPWKARTKDIGVNRAGESFFPADPFSFSVGGPVSRRVLRLCHRQASWSGTRIIAAASAARLRNSSNPFWRRRADFEAAGAVQSREARPGDFTGASA